MQKSNCKNFKNDDKLIIDDKKVKKGHKKRFLAIVKVD